MEFQPILEFVTQQGIWCALFVWLFWTERKEARERESKMQEVLVLQGEKLEKISDTLAALDGRIESLEKSLEK